MTLKKIKEEMLEWTDFYGGDISDRDAINKAKSKEELAEILNRHKNYMEDMLSDAINHLDNFKRRLKLTIMDGVG